MKFSYQYKFLFLVLFVFLIVPFLNAVEQPKDIILYRKNVMSGMSQHMTAIGRIVKGKVSYKGHLSQHAQAISFNAHMVADVFPEGTGEGKTRAKKEIWEQKAEFAKAVKALEVESAKFAKVAQSGDFGVIGTQMKKLNRTCGGCHKKFREKK